MLIRSDMSGMSVLSGLRASVETFPMWWAFPTSEYDARYDSPTAYGGLSLAQYSSTCLARVLPQCVGSSIVPCPGFPFCASGAVDHTRSFSTAGTSGASQVLRRLSSCMPRPEDSGGPAPPCHVGWARVAFGCVKTLGVRNKPFRSCTSTSGDAAPPAAYRILCLRFAHLVRRVYNRDSAMDARLDTGGWLALTRQGLSPCKRRQAYLGAITPGLRRGGQRKRSGRCKESAASAL